MSANYKFNFLREGLFLQFDIMAAFFYLLFGTDVMFKINNIPLVLLSSGAVSLAFGFISLLFRRNSMPAFPAGIVFLLLMLATAGVTVSVLMGGGTWESQWKKAYRVGRK